MKHKIYTLLMALMVAVAFTGCGDDWMPQGSGKFPKNTGGVKLSTLQLNVTDTPSKPQNIRSRAGVDTSGFIVSILNTDRTPVSFDGKLCEWTYAQMPEVITLPTGSYIIMAKSHVPEAAAWGAPYYEGEAPLEVREGEISFVTDGALTCVFKSIKIEVRFAAELLAKMGPDAKVNVRGGVNGSLDWTGSETRIGYFKAPAEATTLIATFSGTLDGNLVVRHREFGNVTAGNYYVITFNLKGGNPTPPDETGEINTPGVDVDVTIEEQDEPGNITPPSPTPGSGDRPMGGENWPDTPGTPDTPPAQEAISVVNAPGSNIDFNGSNACEEGKTYAIVIKSQKPLANLIVDIISKSLNEDMLTDVGLTTHFDLASPGQYETALGKDGFGFPTGNQVVGQTEVNFDISPFIPLLNLYPGETHVFRLTIRDNEGTEKVVNLTFNT